MVARGTDNRAEPIEEPASTGQRLLWFLDRYHGGDGALNTPVVCEITGPLDVAALGRALNDLGERHESLRTGIRGAGRSLTQVIQPSSDLHWQIVDLSHLQKAVQLAEHAVAAELRDPISVSGPLVRARLWRVSTFQHQLVLNVHHIVTDTWSSGLLLEDLAELYRAAVTGEPANLAPVVWQYRHVARWQQRYLDSAQGLALRRSVQHRLEGVTAPAVPVRDYPPEVAVKRIATGTIPALVTGAARRLASEHRSTLFGVLLAGYYLWLRRLCGETDLSVGSVFANRARPECQRTVGFLANLLILRIDLSTVASFSQAIEATRSVLVDAVTGQAVPFHVAARQSPAAGRLRVDDVVFQLLARTLEQQYQVGETIFHGRPPEVSGRFDLELAAMPSGAADDSLAIKLFYSDRLLSAVQAQAYLDGFVDVVVQGVTSPARSLL